VVWLGHIEYFRNVLFNILKFFHILFVITAVGANLTYGVWQARGAIEPEHESFALRGVFFLMVAKPSL
jgi:GH43 family beta-xylosidase